jgi:thiol:disulfide interchange protein DsbD
MPVLRLIAFAAVCALAAPPPVHAQTASRKALGPHVTVELIAARPSLVPGGDTWLGLRFILEPGWHIYWRNPGDSGGPPKAAWTPSAGLMPGAFEWPAPKRIPTPPIVNYGYYGDVVLPFKVSAAGGITAGTLAANHTWLVCKEVCLSGKGQAAITFPLTGDAAAAVPAWQQMIEQARAKVPRPAPAGWRVSAQPEGDTFVVSVRTGARERGGVFFPADEGVLSEAADQRPAPLDDGLRLTLTKSDFLTTVPPVLRGVLALESGATHEIAIPLTGSSPKGPTR